MPTPPKVDAFLVCDHVHRDEASGKFTLVAILDGLGSDMFPTRPIDLGIYLNLTGLNGSYRLRAVVIGPDLASEITDFDFDPFVADDPLARHEFGIRFAGLRLPDPGRYTIRLLYNGTTTTEVTITLDDLESPRSP
jgi:hypothetical protein